MSRLKILFVANVAKEHIRKFHIPTIIKLREKGWCVYVACKVDAEIPEADNVYSMCWERNPFTLKTFRGIRQLKALIAKNEYNIVYCHTPVGGLAARFAARGFRKKGLKVVYCAHGLHFFKGAPLINWLLFYPMEKLMAKFTDTFITINNEDYDRVLRKFNRKMSVKLIDGIGVDFNRLNVTDRLGVRNDYRRKLKLPSDAIVLIYIAEIIQNKNQQMIIKALEIVHKMGYNVHLLLPGPNHHNGEFVELSEKLSLDEYVHFLGWRSDVGCLMAASDIYVASSIREGFGINLVEAQYCHLPVVASSNRGHRAIIKNGENGFLVPVNDYQMLADRIVNLITDKTLYDKFTNLDVSKYSCDKIATNIHSILTELL